MSDNATSGDLEEARAKARAAMGGTNLERAREQALRELEEESSSDLDSLKEKARLAMEGDEHRAKREAEMKEIEEKRKAARLAMEGTEHRARREAREKEIKEKEEMHRRIDEEVKRRKEEVGRLKQQEANERRAASEAKERELKAKEQDFASAKNVIEELKKEQGSSLRPIRTLRSDMASAVKRDNVSAAGMAIAEQKKTEASPARHSDKTAVSSNLSKAGPVIAIIIFLLAGGGGFAWYAYWRNHPTIPPVQAPIVKSLIRAEKNREIEIAKVPSESLAAAIRSIKEEPAASEEVTHIFFTKEIPAVGDTPAKKQLLSFAEFLNYSSSTIPSNFARFVDTYMAGVHKNASSSSSFFILKINSYGNVFQELYDNENGYVRSVFEKFDGYAPGSELAGRAFADKLVKNIQARALMDASSTPVVLYSFLDRQTLIIAESEDALYRAYVVYNTPQLK